MATASAVKVGRTEAGYCVRIEGRGTMNQSPIVLEFVGRTLRDGAASGAPGVVMDPSACEYVDSTFLGCLLGLH